MKNKLPIRFLFLTLILSIVTLERHQSIPMNDISWKEDAFIPEKNKDPVCYALNIFAGRWSLLQHTEGVWGRGFPMSGGCSAKRLRGACPHRESVGSHRNKERYLSDTTLDSGVTRLNNESKYLLWYIMKGKASGRLLFIIPFRVYYENFASVILKARKNSDGTTDFRYAGIGIPGYLLRTIDFMGHEIHIRIASHSIEESLHVGRKILLNWTYEYPEFSRVIKPEKRKVLPFGFDLDDVDNFSFSMDENGLIVPHSVKTKINPQYLWPAKDDIPLTAYGALAGALKFFSRPFTPNGKIEDSNNLHQEWFDEGLDFTYDFNKIGRMLEQVIRDFVIFRQEKPFSVRYYLKEKENGIYKIRGEAFPDVEIWSGYNITSYIRDVEWDEENREIIRESLRMELYSKKGRGGYGVMELKKLE